MLMKVAVRHFHITIVMLFPFNRIWSSLVILRPSGVFSLLKLMTSISDSKSELPCNEVTRSVFMMGS